MFSRFWGSLLSFARQHFPFPVDSTSKGEKQKLALAAFEKAPIPLGVAGEKLAINLDTGESETICIR